MWTRSAGVAGIVICIAGVVGCSSTDSDPVSEPAKATTVSQDDQLRESAEQLDKLAVAGDYDAAWEYYSQRCQGIIGNVDTYKILLDAHYKDWNPNPTDWIVRTNGSSAQVVTVDSDPSAPKSAMDPRTWTFIDGRWQFDNC